MHRIYPLIHLLEHIKLEIDYSCDTSVIMDLIKMFFWQLLILMGKFHIHKMKWIGSKPNFSFYKRFQAAL